MRVAGYRNETGTESEAGSGTETVAGSNTVDIADGGGAGIVDTVGLTAALLKG